MTDKEKEESLNILAKFEKLGYEFRPNEDDPAIDFVLAKPQLHSNFVITINEQGVFKHREYTCPRPCTTVMEALILEYDELKLVNELLRIMKKI